MLPAEILECYANLLEACASPHTDTHACTYAAVHTPTYLLCQYVHRAKHLTWVHFQGEGEGKGIRRRDKKMEWDKEREREKERVRKRQ